MKNKKIYIKQRIVYPTMKALSPIIFYLMSFLNILQGGNSYDTTLWEFFWLHKRERNLYPMEKIHLSRVFTDRKKKIY